jgi:hypothetical protein
MTFATQPKKALPDNTSQFAAIADALLVRTCGYAMPELRRLFSRIDDLGSVDLREWRQRVKSRAGPACDFPHFDSSYQ